MYRISPRGPAVFARPARACAGLAAVGTLAAAMFGAALPANASTTPPPLEISSNADLITALSTGGSYTLTTSLTFGGSLVASAASTSIDLGTNSVVVLGHDGSTPALEVQDGDSLTMTDGRLTVQGASGANGTGSDAAEPGGIAVQVNTDAHLNVDQATFTGGSGGNGISDIGSMGITPGAGGAGGDALDLAGVVTDNMLTVLGGAGGAGGSGDQDTGLDNRAGGAGGAGGAAINDTAAVGGVAVITSGTSASGVHSESSGGAGGAGGISSVNGSNDGGAGGVGGDAVTGSNAALDAIAVGGGAPGDGGAAGGGGTGSPGMDGDPGQSSTADGPTVMVNTNTSTPVVYSEYILTSPSPLKEADATSYLPATPTWTGYTLNGWSEDPDATGGDDSATPIGGADNVVYAVWTKNPPASTPGRPTPTPTVTPFTDVPASNPFAKHINWLHSNHITNGYADGTFRPGSTITREAAISFLYREAHPDAGDAATPATAPFTDVPVSNPFAGDIAWAKNAGITRGYANGSFHPGSAVTRAAVAAFLYRDEHAGKDAAAPSTAPFTDVPTASAFAGDIASAKTDRIVHGYADGTFRPAAPIAREATAAFLYRFGLNDRA